MGEYIENTPVSDPNRAQEHTRNALDRKTRRRHFERMWNRKASHVRSWENVSGSDLANCLVRGRERCLVHVVMKIVKITSNSNDGRHVIVHGKSKRVDGKWGTEWDMMLVPPLSHCFVLSGGSVCSWHESPWCVRFFSRKPEKNHRRRERGGTWWRRRWRKGTEERSCQQTTPGGRTDKWPRRGYGPGWRDDQSTATAAVGFLSTPHTLRA